MHPPAPPVFEHHGVSVRRLDCPFPIPPDLGQAMLEHGIYSTGNDFTSAFAKDNPDYQGSSLLRQLWEGKAGRATDGIERATLWLMEHAGRPVGVVAWLRTDNADGSPAGWIDEVPAHSNHRPKARIAGTSMGGVMCYLAREHRGRGVVRRIVQELLAPEALTLAHYIRAQGSMPYIAATDATWHLMEAASTVPMTTHFYPCRARQDDLWRYWREHRMYPEHASPQQAFLVAPEPIAHPRRQMRR